MKFNDLEFQKFVGINLKKIEAYTVTNVFIITLDSGIFKSIYKILALKINY